MFSLNDKVIYPGHGVAKVVRILEKCIAGKPTQFFELHLMSKDMTVLVPVCNLSVIGVRKISSSDFIQDIFNMLAVPIKIAENTEGLPVNWNKRNKDYQAKLRSGDLLEISKIYKTLKLISARKELSFGEKYLLQQTEGLLVEEIALVYNSEEDSALECLRSALSKNQMFSSL
ncbi:MAG: BadM/Rrf2 family transcriptional regulator [candidate division TM6 bacterium GW2011_GWF2_32_72]|nr:MAG: BadM/Rrf2 family transcriptional regulator [candidate division TM6 bacterium GW2011_GWF2_32_72]